MSDGKANAIRFRVRIVALFALTLTWHGCGSSGVTSAVVRPETSALKRLGMRYSPSPFRGTFTYVSELRGGVTYYPAAKGDPSPVGRLRDIDGPQGLAAHGNDLYVADSANRRVLRFTNGSSTPSLILRNPHGFPSGVAVGSDGTVYVMDAIGPGKFFQAALWEYPPNSPTGNEILVDNQSAPFFVAVDAAGDVFAAGYVYPGDYVWVISELPSGPQQDWKYVTGFEQGYVGGIRIDPANNLVVDRQDPGRSRLDVYGAPSYKHVIRSIACPNEGDCVDFNFNAQGDALVVADAKNGVAYRLAYPSGRLLATISKGLSRKALPYSAVDVPGPAERTDSLQPPSP